MGISDTPHRRAQEQDAENAWLRERRQRRIRRNLGALLVVVAFVAAAIAISAGRGGAPPRPGSAAARHDVAAVMALLRGIPESGTTLGSPRAPVTVTEFADLECSVCRAFALGGESTLIAHEVRGGEVKLVYRSLCTATCTGPLGRAAFPAQQVAAYAAGLQRLGWYYIELFYHEQGAEGTTYATPLYLDDLARQISPLHYAQWKADRALSSLSARVAADGRSAASLGFQFTPTIVIQGPRGRAKPIIGAAGYGSLQAAIRSVR